MTRKQENRIAICVVLGIILLSVIVRLITKSEPYNHYLDDKAFADLQTALGVEDIADRCYLSYPAPEDGEPWIRTSMDVSPYLSLRDTTFWGYFDGNVYPEEEYGLDVWFLSNQTVHLEWDADSPEVFRCHYNGRVFYVKMPQLGAFLQERYQETGGK